MNVRVASHRKPSRLAFTRIELLVVVITILVVVFLLIAHLAMARHKALRINCASNLKQIGLAFKLWAGDHQDKYPMQVPVALGGTLEGITTGPAWRHFQVMSNELVTPYLLRCRLDPERTVARGFDFNTLSDSNVSYFVGIDVTGNLPGAWMAGDRNLTTNQHPVSRGLVILVTNMMVGWQDNIHIKAGNLLLCDGSAQQASTAGLPEHLVHSGLATNRLVVP